MKKLLILSALLIFACNSDDDNSNDSNDSNSIEGRGNFISSPDGGENDESNDSCDLESYLTLTNGTGQATIYDNEDENGNIGSCQVIGSFDVSYSVGSSNQNYIFSIQGGEALSAIVDGNTLTLIETSDASTSNCSQQEGVITDEVIFIRN
jgi:hypothetical protein